SVSAIKQNGRSCQTDRRVKYKDPVDHFLFTCVKSIEILQIESQDRKKERKNKIKKQHDYWINVSICERYVRCFLAYSRTFLYFPVNSSLCRIQFLSTKNKSSSSEGVK